MHMADALLSPQIGGAMWAVSAGALGWAVTKLNGAGEGKPAVFPGMMAAFVFAVQMINFSIPGTGSSGHLSGGLLLAVALGPVQALPAIASILAVQALFFADGGILAFGSNLFNMGVIPCFVGYPVYRFLLEKWPGKDGKDGGKVGVIVACSAAALISAQLGAFAVVLQTTFSGITELPFGLFVLFMQPIHLAIGLAEGVASAFIIMHISKIEPAMLYGHGASARRGVSRRLALTLLAAALFTGGVLAWFASSSPDGLEWSIEKVTAGTELGGKTGYLHSLSEKIQSKTSVMPDYSLPAQNAGPGAERAGTSLAGVAGGVITFVMVLVFYAVSRTRRDGFNRAG